MVMNKRDILPDKGAEEEVMAFIEEHSRRLLRLDAQARPQLFSISARQALARKCAGEDPSQEGDDGFAELEARLHSLLTSGEVLWLKLEGPLSATRRVLEECMVMAEHRQAHVLRDQRSLQMIDDDITSFAKTMKEEFMGQTGRIDASVLQLKLRADAFVEERTSFANIWRLLDFKAFQSELEVSLGDIGQETEGHVSELIDWIVGKNLRQWQFTHEQLNMYFASTDIGRPQWPVRKSQDPFHSSRQKLLDTLGRKVQNTTSSFEKDKELRSPVWVLEGRCSPLHQHSTWQG